MSLDTDARALLKVNPYSDINDMRRAILSEQGPPQPGTRLVLLGLLEFAGPGGVAWPGQDKIAAKCGMCLRSIRTHLQLADDQGWVSRYKQREPGKKWAYTLYMLHKPGEAANFASSNIKGAQPANSSIIKEKSAD